MDTPGRKGKIAQVLGAVVDVEFPKEGGVPNIYDALLTTNSAIDSSEYNLTLEVEQHLGDNTVRCVAMDTTDGLVRGKDVLDTGRPITVPVGPKCLGRIIDVIGRPVDQMGPVAADDRWDIHRPTPSFEEQATSKVIFESLLRSSW